MTIHISLSSFFEYINRCSDMFPLLWKNCIEYPENENIILTIPLSGK